MSLFVCSIGLYSVFDEVKRCNSGCNLKWFCLSIILYVDDILLLVPTVSSLQQLLHICEIELAWLVLSFRVYMSVLAIIVSVLI